MEVSKVELKILLKEFLTASNRVLRADFSCYASELKKFISFLESKEIILDYIMSCGSPEYDIETEIKEVENSYGHAIFSLGETEKKEVANVYAVIKFLATNNYSGRSYVYWGYSSSKKYQDKVDAFGDKFIRILITHIESYLSTLCIKMGIDENATIQINIDTGNFQNSQFNLASTGGNVNATQNNTSMKELDELIEKVLSATKDMKKDDMEIINDCMETIQSLKEPKPKKGIIRVALTTLKGIAGTAEFLAAADEIIQYVQKFI